MAQIAQAYFHFRTEMSEAELKNFGKRVAKSSRAAALSNFAIEVEITVDVVEGSVKGRVTAIGILIGGFAFVADYKGFKEGVVEICQDARSFGADVCDKAVELANVAKRYIVRTERRTKTSGKLGRLLSDLDKLQNSVDSLSPAQVKGELSRLNRELELIARDLAPVEQQKLGKILDQTKLPPPRKWPQQDAEPPKTALKEDQIELLGASEQQPNPKRKPTRYRTSFKVKPKKPPKVRGSSEQLLRKEQANASPEAT